jgi:hypothetical protein
MGTSEVLAAPVQYDRVSRGFDGQSCLTDDAPMFRSHPEHNRDAQTTRLFVPLNSELCCGLWIAI